MTSTIEYFENNLDSSIDIDGTIDYSHGYVRHNLFLPYETLKAILNLDEKTRAIDEMLLNSAHIAIEHFTGRILSLRKISEDVTAENGAVVPHEIPVKSVTSLIDTKTLENIELSEITILENLINIGSHDHDSHVCRLSYVAGYESNDGPAELTEAVLKTFLQKRHLLHREITESLEFSSLSSAAELNDEVKMLLAKYRR